MPSSSRAVFPVGRAIQNLRSVCNRSSLRRHAKHQPHHGNARKTCDPDRTPRRTPYRHLHRRNEGGMPTFSKRQRRRQRRRSRQKCHKNLRPQSCHYWKMYRDRHWKRPVCAQTIYAYAPSQKCRSTCQPRHHRSRGGVLLFSKRQKIPQKHLFGSHCPSVRLYPIHRQPKKCHACARRIYAPDQNRNGHRANRYQRHRSEAVALMFNEQRNPAQRNRLRGIIFIRSSRKSVLRMIYQNGNRCRSAKSRMRRKCAVRCDPKLCKQNHPLFVM